MPNAEYMSLVRRGRQKKKSLILFLRRLKRKNPLNIQKLIKAANKQTWEQTDCLDCANCCTTMTPTFKKKEVQAIATHLGMTYQKYFDKYLKIDEDNGDIINQSTPCQHLRKSNKCAIYEIRPDDCRGFPHHVRSDFFYQVGEKTYQENIPRCPATLRFIENLQRIVEGDKN